MQRLGETKCECDKGGKCTCGKDYACANYPFFGWLLSPMVAAAAMSLSCVSVVLNALRLRKVAV